MSDREAILADEFVRATPGLRPFSVGILTLARQLKVKLASGESPADAAGETLTLAWLLDERNPLAEIRAIASGPREAFEAAVDAYSFTIPPAFLLTVRAEIERTNRAVEAASGYSVEPKPDAREGPQPAGKS